MKKLSLLFLSLLLWFAASAQDKLLTRGQALADIDSLVTYIGAIHPDMFAYCPKARFDDSLARVRERLPDTLRVSQFWLAVTPCVTMLGDGHTGLYRDDKMWMADNNLFFPVKVQISSGDSTITLNDGLDTVLSINGHPTKELIAAMLPCFSGEKTFLRIAHLQGYFNALLPLMYPAETYECEIKRGNNISRISEKAVPYDKIVRPKTATVPGANKNYSYTLVDDNTALFIFNAFSDMDKFKPFLERMFTELKEKNVGNLIIDIRKNGGGNSELGDELLQYISPEPFSQYDKVVVYTSRYQREFELKMAKRMGIPVEEIESKDTTYTCELTPLRDNHLRYSGKIYLLISHNTFSSAANFSGVFKYFKLGTIVGEESGGMNVAFGDLIFMTLPNSELPLSVSYKKFYQYGATDDDIHGTIPDITLPADKALDYTLDLIRTR